MSVYLLVLYALFACVDAVNDLDVFSLSVSYSVVLVNQETVYMIRSFACVGYASIEGDHWSPKATFLLWELRHVARADSLTSESAHAEKYNSIVDTRSLDKIDTRAHVGNYKCTVCVTILYVTLYTQEIDARGLLALGRVIEGLADSLACLKLSLGSSVYIGSGSRFNTAYWEAQYGVLDDLARAPRIKYSRIFLSYNGYGVSDILDTAYQTYWVRSIGLLQYNVLARWVRRIGSLGTVFCTSWVRRIELLGYGVLAESVHFLIFDQSIIYDVYTDVDTAYSSKSGNGLFIRQSLGYILVVLLLVMDMHVRYGYSSVGRFDVFFRNQLLVFQQHQDESLYDSWTRFKDIIRKVPNHGLRDLRKFSDIGGWYAIEDCVQYDKKCSNPTSAISDETIANPNAQIVGDDMVRVQEYTPPVTYPEEVEKTLGTPIEVEPLNETKLEEVGLNCNHNTPFSSREVPSFDGPEPQPLLNSPSLDESLGDVTGPEPPIKPHSPDSSRMKVVDYLTTQTPHSPHVANLLIPLEWILNS
ncbi:hypothetical protein Tco_0051786 [Tanacetum coccineum]